MKARWRPIAGLALAAVLFAGPFAAARLLWPDDPSSGAAQSAPLRDSPRVAVLRPVSPPKLDYIPPSRRSRPSGDTTAATGESVSQPPVSPPADVVEPIPATPVPNKRPKPDFFDEGGS